MQNPRRWNGRKYLDGGISTLCRQKTGTQATQANQRRNPYYRKKSHGKKAGYSHQPPRDFLRELRGKSSEPFNSKSAKPESSSG
jgi:hypothetical protein